jgi:hypothetical protein
MRAIKRQERETVKALETDNSMTFHLHTDIQTKANQTQIIFKTKRKFVKFVLSTFNFQ